MVERNHFLKQTLVNTWIFNSKLFSLIIVLFDTHVLCIQSWTKEESHMLYLLLQVNIVIEQCTASFKSIASHLFFYSSHLFKVLSQRDLLTLPAIISILVLQAWFLWCYLTISFMHPSFFLLRIFIEQFLARGKIHFVKPLFSSLQTSEKEFLTYLDYLLPYIPCHSSVLDIVHVYFF